IHRRSVDDQFDRDFARLSHARALQVPVRLLVVAQLTNRVVQTFVQARGHAGRYAHGPRLVQLHLTAPRSDRQTVDSKIHQVPLAVRNVSPPFAHAFSPRIVIEPAVEFDVAASQPDSLAVDAGKVSLAADARAEPGVERVVPDVQLPWRGRVYGRD